MSCLMLDSPPTHLARAASDRLQNKKHMTCHRKSAAGWEAGPVQVSKTRLGVEKEPKGKKVRYAAAQHARADTDDCCFPFGSVTSLSAKKNIVGSIAACFLKNSHASLERRNFATDRDNLPPSQKRIPLRRRVANRPSREGLRETKI